MKNNTFKRVLAGSLALLTVAAYVPANVGGILATNGVSLTAVAADSATVSWAGVGEYITSISDGTTTIDTNTTKNTATWSFAKDSVVTIVSSIPLLLTHNSTVVNNSANAATYEVKDASADLAAKTGNTFTYKDGSYIATESNGVYTYKVRNDANNAWIFAGVDASVQFVNSTGNTITLGDGNTVETTKVDATITYDGENDAPTTAAKKSVVKIAADKAFEVYVQVDGVQEIANVVAAYDSTDGSFVAKVTIPDTDKTVKVYFNKVTPNYTYTNNGTELLATAENAPQVTAASIKATYQNKVRLEKTDTGYEANNVKYKYDTVTDMKSGDSVANASRVELTFTNDVTQEITSVSADGNASHYSLKITRDGEELKSTDYVTVDDNPNNTDGDKTVEYNATIKSNADKFVPNAAAATDAESKLSFTQTGKYVVEYTVYTKRVSNGSTTLKPETLTYEFTIKEKDALTAENVKLTASGTNLKTNPTNKAAIVDGVVEFEVAEDWTNKDIITVTPTIFEDADFELAADSTFDAGSGTANGSAKSVTGTTRSSTLNQVNTMTVVYNNSEFGSDDKSITVKWKLVEAKKQVTVTENEVYSTEKGVTFASTFTAGEPYFMTTVDKLDTFEADLFEALTINNAEQSEISFEYVDSYGANEESEELYYHETGLPTEKGEYSVFAMYDGEIVAAFNVLVVDHALYAAPTDEQLNYTYGTKPFTSDDLAFVDVDDKEVADAGVKNATITYTKLDVKNDALTAAESKKITVDGKYNNETVYEVDGKNYIESKGDPYDVPENGYVDAGLYIVTISATRDTTTVAKEGYALIQKKFVVNVAQKEITADMVDFAATTYTGKTVTPGTLTVKDTAVKDADGKATEIKAVTTDGTTSASAVGEYTVNVQVNEDKDNGSPNYTGKVAAKWHIVKKAKQEAMTGLVFVDKETTIYNNGQIHFEITRPADTQFQNGVAQYGVVFDKSGKLDAPEKNNIGGVVKYPRKEANKALNDQAFAKATAALQVGNGYTEGKQSAKLKAEAPTKYGANINVLDVETGAWLRPYVIDGKGEIYYGEAVYVNLVQEATDALNLEISQLGATDTDVYTKDDAKKDQSAKVLAEKSWRKDVKSGYDTKKNAYYVYGSYTLAEDSNVKTDAVQGFGVVVDKKGVFSAADGTANAGKTADGKTTVADGLKLGKGFIEGKSGSNKMDVDEYGAMISPYNSVTGVWVRAYVDLGNDLVVYTNPIYIKDISTIYNPQDVTTDMTLGLYPDNRTRATTKSDFDNAVADAGTNRNTDVTDKTGLIAYVPGLDKVRIGFKAFSINGVAPSYAGVIIEKTGAFLDKEDGKYQTNLVGEKLASAKTKMVIGNGYVQGKKAPNEGFYFANVTQEKYRVTASAAESNIPIVARPYAIYEINGNEVVVYGDPVVTKLNDASQFNG